MAAPRPRLFIGNKNYSSWSLRPWLCLRWAGIDFEELLINLRQEGYGKGEIAQVLEVSPSGRVPALHVGALEIWDSLAIAEWAAECHDAKGESVALWPEDPGARAVARAATCEMHSGFPAIRTGMPMNLDRRCAVQSWPAATQSEIRRVLALWGSLRERYGASGEWLMGQRSIVDAFYAPVVTRFRTYGVAVPDALREYSERVLSDPDFLEWEASPIGERFGFIDDLYR